MRYSVGIGPYLIGSVSLAYLICSWPWKSRGLPLTPRGHASAVTKAVRGAAGGHAVSDRRRGLSAPSSRRASRPPSQTSPRSMT